MNWYFYDYGRHVDIQSATVFKMHLGSFKTIEEVIAHIIGGGQRNGGPSVATDAAVTEYIDSCIGDRFNSPPFPFLEGFQFEVRFNYDHQKQRGVPLSVLQICRSEMISIDHKLEGNALTVRHAYKKPDGKIVKVTNKYIFFQAP